ncbi:hypothetical protein KKA15_02105 [Patescibacteria group bacterium]|nr:hypothetical protein [Patescibacteria group bacterium]
MRIYFSANESQNLRSRYQKIIDILVMSGNSVMSNLELDKSARFSDTDVEKFRAAGQTLLEQMDSLVIDATIKSPENGYLVALALTHKKPTLFLHEKGTDVDSNLLSLQKDKNTAAFLVLQDYQEEKLKKYLLEFLQFAEKKGGKEIPKIKFTLRITPKIERYLHWKTHNTKKSKADFLRERIDKMIEEDEEFRRYNK